MKKTKRNSPPTGGKRPEWKTEFIEVLNKAAKDISRTAALKRLSQVAMEAGLYDRNVFPKGGQDE